MADPADRRRGYSLASKVLLFSIGIYIVLTACILVVWNVGAPHIGVPGRIPELLGLEREDIRGSLEDKLERMENWLSARQAEAQRFAQIYSPSSQIGLLAVARSPGLALESVRRDLESRYKAISEGAPAISRILVLRREDGRILIDSSGDVSGSDFIPGRIPKDAESGQFRDMDRLYFFSTTSAASGVPILFVLVTPLTAFLDGFHDNRFDREKGLGFALVDARGRLLSPLSIPDLQSSFAPGVFLTGKDKLDGMAENGEPAVLRLGVEPISVGAKKVRVAADDEIYIVAVTSRRKTISRLAQDSIAMAALALLMATAASILTVRRIKVLLSPLERLLVAVEAFGRSEPFALPEGAPGEIGEITRAFSDLAKRVGAWKSDLEAEVETRTRTLKLTAELCGIYANDPSENASLTVVNILKTSLGADAVVVFYVKGTNEYRYYLSGSDIPVTLAIKPWLECVRQHPKGTEFARFGPWMPPGLDVPFDSWLSYMLHSAEPSGRFLFLGRRKGEWSEEEASNFATVARTISPIVQVRREREVGEQIRQEAEERLAGNERRLRTFLEGSRDMIYAADSRDLVTEINAAGLSLLGRSDKAEIVGVPFSSFALNPEDREQLLRRVREVGYAADYEIVLKRGDGSSVFCLETAYAIRDPDGDIVELQGIVKDITERISSESALWKTNIELADANLRIQRTQALMVQHEKLASIGQLAAGVAHEINNPLGFLKSNHEMIEKHMRTIRKAWDEAKSSPAADFAEIERRWDLARRFTEIGSILDESDEGFARIMHIVGNLKSFSRVDQGADFKPYDVNAGIESTLIVARNEIKYVADVEKDLGDLPPIRARGGEINQVILNVLVNAAQAIEGQKRSEKGLIEIRTAALGDRVVIGIRDDGPGIPEELRLKIFDPFFTTKEPGKGTGLGLSISYDIVVSKHGGRLDVDSTPGHGATFTIELPIEGPPGAA